MHYFLLSITVRKLNIIINDRNKTQGNITNFRIPHMVQPRMTAFEIHSDRNSV
jgi:hypothetical protein